jgi:hypothetical protein
MVQAMNEERKEPAKPPSWLHIIIRGREPFQPWYKTFLIVCVILGIITGTWWLLACVAFLYVQARIDIGGIEDRYWRNRGK